MPFPLKYVNSSMIFYRFKQKKTSKANEQKSVLKYTHKHRAMKTYIECTHTHSDTHKHEHSDKLTHTHTHQQSHKHTHIHKYSNNKQLTID